MHEITQGDMNPCPEGFELVYVPHLQTTVCVPSAIAGLYRRWMGQVNVVAGPRMLDELHEHPDDRPYVWDLPDGP